MPTIRRDGIKLTYDEWGRGSPALVFVHGWTCDRSFFRPQMEHFVEKHRVVCVDLRGHGESDQPEGAYPIRMFADDVAHLIAERKLGRVIAVEPLAERAGDGVARHHRVVLRRTGQSPIH